MKARVLIIITALALLFLASGTAWACECRERPTVPDAYEASENVVVLILKSVGDEQAVLTVGGALKGALNQNEELIFQQSAGKDCKWRFEVTDIKKAFLFFLDKRPADDFWQASTCSPSKYIGDAEKDLKSLRKHFQRTPAPDLPLTDEPRPPAKPRDGR